jgi:hypothetical protein
MSLCAESGMNHANTFVSSFGQMLAQPWYCACGISAYLKCAHATCGNEVVGIPALEFLAQRAARVHKEQRDDDYHRSTYGSAHPPLPEDLAALHETLPAAIGEPRGFFLTFPIGGAAILVTLPRTYLVLK